MKILTITPFTRALIAIAIVFCSSPLVEAADEVTKWEYRVIRIDDSRPEQAGGRAARGSAQEQLNELGAEGWELVSVRTDSQANRNSPIFYLKRPLRKESGKTDEPKK